jgi:hypothetical protein
VEDGVAADQLKEMMKRVGAIAVFGCHWRIVEGERRRRWSKSSGEGGLSDWFSFGRGQVRVGGDGGTGQERGEEMKWQGVLGSLVLGEQKKPKDPRGGWRFRFKQNQSGGLWLLSSRW